MKRYKRLIILFLHMFKKLYNKYLIWKHKKLFLKIYRELLHSNKSASAQDILNIAVDVYLSVLKIEGIDINDNDQACQ